MFQIPGVAGGSRRGCGAGHGGVRCPSTSTTAGSTVSPRLVEFVATDPACSTTPRQNASTTLPTAAGGLTFRRCSRCCSAPSAPAERSPRTTPAASTLTARSGSMGRATTLGSSRSPPAAPRLERVAGARQFLVLDTKSRTVLLNGTASRRWQLDTSSRWFTLAPATTRSRSGRPPLRRHPQHGVAQHLVVGRPL